MSDPLRTDTSRALDAMSAVERDAKIEQLLLLGLDHYFAAEYDQAINVWTRALFLDRAHPRARAYIDRARSALAERQRESEELLHNGIDAFRRGDAVRARELLLAAIDRGAPSEEASSLLDRLARLEAAQPSPTARDAGRPASRMAPGTETPRRSVAAWAASALALAAIAAAVLVALDWRQVSALVSERDAVPRAGAVSAMRDAVPPPPRRGEVALARARALTASGRLHDALNLLNTVRPADPQRPDADQLRADIQRQLLALAPVPPARPTREKGIKPLP